MRWSKEGGAGAGRGPGEFIAINRFRVAMGRDRQLIKNSAAFATIEWNLRWQHTHHVLAMGVPGIGRGWCQFWVSFTKEQTVGIAISNQQSASTSAFALGMQRASAFGACQLTAAGRPGQKWQGKAFDTLCLLFSAYEFGTCASVGRETCSRMRETRGEPWKLLNNAMNATQRNAARRKCESCKTKREFLRFVFIVKSQHSNNGNNVSRVNNNNNNNSPHCFNNPIGQGPRKCGNSFKIKYPESDVEPGND